MISEATLGRHISGLNQILSEFELSIQNGQLERTWAPDPLAFISASFVRFGPVKIGRKNFKNRKKEGSCRLRRTLGPTLSRTAIGLGPLGTYTQQRLRVNACQFQDIELKMQGYFENIFYQRLHRRTNDFFAGQHITLSQEDGNDDFLFISAFPSVLPLHTMEYILGFGGEIASLITQLIQEMKGQDFARGLYWGSGDLRTKPALRQCLSFSKAISCKTNTSTTWNCATHTCGRIRLSTSGRHYF